MSFRINLSNIILKELKETEEELKQLEETVVFGKYVQKSDGIYIKHKDADVKVANIKMESVKLYFDELEMFDVKIDWTYFNLKNGRRKSLKMMTKEEIESRMKRDIAFKSSNSIMPFIESVLHSDWENIEIENGVFIEGFFYHSGKVVDNTSDKDSEYTSDDVKEAIELVNAIISNRGTARMHDATVMRFMLWSPFSYCLKQIGFYDANYGLILYGKSQASKTGSVINFSWFYSEPDLTDKAVSTMPVYAKRISESTLPSLIDEAGTFLQNKDNIDPIKRNILSKMLRAVMSRNNDGIDEPYALSLPIFTYNESVALEEHFRRRFKILKYDSTMYVSDDDAIEFTKKYNPKSPNSPLKKLRALGWAFKNKIIPYIERQDDALMRIEDLTIKILKEISKENGVEFDSVYYEVQESNTESMKDVGYEIRRKLNLLFRESRGFKNKYTKEDFIYCAKNGEIPFLFKYNPKFKDADDDKFIIHKTYFVKTIANLVDESYLSLEDIVDALGLENPVVERRTVNGKTIHGFLIDGAKLEWNVFGIKTDRDEDEYEDIVWYCDG